MLEGFLKNTKKIIQTAALAGAIALAPEAKGETVEKGPVDAPNGPTETEKHSKELLKKIATIEASFQSSADKKIILEKPAYVIMAESQILGNNPLLSEKLISDKYIAESLTEGLVNNLPDVEYLSRDAGFARGVEKERELQTIGLIAPEEMKEHGYVAPDAYIVVSQKIEGENMIFSANIVSLNSQKSEMVSVAGNSFEVISSSERQQDMSQKLLKLVEEKIGQNI